MSSLKKIVTKVKAIIRRGAPSLRNVIYSRLGIWPVGSLSDHWLADLPVYCISLPRAAERRRLLSAQVEQMGLRRFSFLDAVDARALSFDELKQAGIYDSERCRQFHTRDLTLNEIACSLSHIEAYRRVLRAGDSWALIIEDDALFRTRRVARFRFESIPVETDIVFLNAFLDQTPPLDPIGPFLFRDTSYNGSAAAYMISLAAAHQLLTAALPVVHAADGLTGRALALEAGRQHPFRQRGVSISLKAAILYPEAVTNGSTEHYYRSSIR
jgi:glycosyl transferase family 25